MKTENLERHIRNQHPRSAVDVTSVLTPEEMLEVERGRASRAPVLTKQGRLLVAIVTIALAAILFVVIANPFRPVGPSVGQEAPNFSLQTSGGSTVALSSFRGFPVLLEFMDVDCPACQHEAPILVSLYANFSSTVRFLSVDVNFVGIGTDDNTKIEAFKSSYGTTWTFALDGDQTVTHRYGVSSTPTTFIIDRNGIVFAVVHPPDNTYAGYAALLNRVLET